MNQQILIPMFVYVLSMWASAIYNFRTRISTVKSGQISMKYFKVLSGENPPEKMLAVSRHYDNQFQLPILFFITCLVYMVMNAASPLTLFFMWGFVVSRWAHSFVLLGKNQIMWRVRAFTFGWLMVLALWIQLMISQFQG